MSVFGAERGNFINWPKIFEKKLSEKKNLANNSWYSYYLLVSDLGNVRI